MASSITNVSTSSFLLKDMAGNSYDLAPGATITLDDWVLPYKFVMDGIQRGILSTTNWAPANLKIDSLNLLRRYTYNSDDTVNYAEIVFDSSTWRQTYTYSGGKLATISAWTRQ